MASSRLRRRATRSLGALALTFAVLCVPTREPLLGPAPARGHAFAWDQDAFWHSLERQFLATREAGCAAVGPSEDRELAAVGLALGRLGGRSVSPNDPELDSIEDRYFRAAPLVAACPRGIREFVALHDRIRVAVKGQSRHWDMSDLAARSRVYRALYGSRIAAEEVMLYHPDSLPSLLVAQDEASATPSAVVDGVTIHSGDILASRGGYPTSALIARGNDYPGNFSHIALVYVDATTREAYAIEAHIEVGVVMSPAKKYLQDKKLRIMVLRPRADLPQLMVDPLLPHRAAAAMRDRVMHQHVPYDFEMDYQDPSRLFCSEVASAAYHTRDVTLWMGLSTISRPGLRRWLWDFGVRHFETEEPSDLEYDPQLVVVAEWRDRAMLRQDRIDNAVIDAMLDEADNGERLEYRWYKLPAARIAKAYSWVLNRFGRAGPVPEGMSAEAALRHTEFTAREKRLAGFVALWATGFERERGYPAPVWRLETEASRVVREAGTR